MWDKRAEFLKLANSNSVKMILDQGHGDTKLVTLPLMGIYSQQTSPRGEEECKTFIFDWFTKHNTSGLRWAFVATTCQLGTDRFAAVITDITNTYNLNAELAEFINVNGYQ